MKDVMDYLKKNLGMDEDEEHKEDNETIIVPEHSFYEIILMKTNTLDDFDYALNQVVEAKNPIIMDMTMLEKDNPDDFKIAAEKLKAFRDSKGGEAILLCQNGKSVIIVTPPEIKLIRK
ncbi:MAG TPA: hypothetical protein VK444_08745 [Methanobacteriaceae archaeon]|nr:hypothetical protein [Methanobacteriaceae archaeon]